MMWHDAIGEWTTALRAAGRSETTVRLYRHYVRQLAAQNRDPWAVRGRDLERFLARRGWSPEARKSARTAVTRFYRWAHGVGYVAEDPSAGLAPVSVPQGQPKPIPERLLQRALMAATGRDRLMMLLAAYGGLRCSEIARVRGTDLVGGVLYVTGKGGKVRRVPVVHPDLTAALERAGEAWLFPNGRGEHLSAGHVTKLLSNALPGEWTGHKLRHRFGTAGYAATRDLLAVGRVLGHSRPETTQRYVLVPDDAIMAVVKGAA